ncbi:hypothetical protein ACB092_05G215400 [Castanea dentata]
MAEWQERKRCTSKNTGGVVNWPWQAAQLGRHQCCRQGVFVCFFFFFFFEFIYVVNLEFIYVHRLPFAFFFHVSPSFCSPSFYWTFLAYLESQICISCFGPVSIYWPK